jgi:cell filamentation protein
METLPELPSISVEGYCEIHRYIFQDVHEWAGKIRTVDLAKGNDLFCLTPYIERELAKRFEGIRAENSLRGLSADEYALRAAHHVCELNAIHPFRDGNGRTLRAFLFLLGKQVGHAIELSRIDPQAWNAASRESFRTGDSKPMHNIIAQAIEG